MVEQIADCGSQGFLGRAWMRVLGGVTPERREAEKCSFLKKRTKKLLIVQHRGRHEALVQMNKSFLLLFFQKRSAFFLASLCLGGPAAAQVLRDPPTPFGP